MEFDMVDNASLGTVIKVVGVGGAGGNAVQHMINKGMSGVEFIAANTDAQALSTSKADNIIQIGETGLGAGMKPEVGRKLAEESRQRIEDSLRGAHMVFIAAGMGGGTGTGAAPIVAEIAKSLGALTVAVVSKPFSHEGQKCMDIADEGLEALSANVDSLIVILNEKLEEIYEDESLIEWLQHADDVLNNAVAGIAEIINVPGHINVDFNDVKTIMGEQGKAMMGTATASGVDRARIAAEQAVASPLLDGIDLSGARGVLVNVTASRGRLCCTGCVDRARYRLRRRHGRRYPRHRGGDGPGPCQEKHPAGTAASAAHRYAQQPVDTIGCTGRRANRGHFGGRGDTSGWL